MPTFGPTLGQSMKTILFRYPFEAKDHPEIHATLLDFRRFGEVHPVIKEVRIVGEATALHTRYFVQEEVKVGGWLKMKPRYFVDVTAPDPGKLILYKSRIMGIMKLEIRLSMTPPDAQGKIELLEEVKVSRIPLMTGMFLKVFRDAHILTYDALRERLARNSALHP